MFYSTVKFNEEPDGDSVEPVQPTVLELPPSSVCNGKQGAKKWSYLNFDDGFDFVSLEAPPPPSV